MGMGMMMGTGMILSTRNEMGMRLGTRKEGYRGEILGIGIENIWQRDDFGKKVNKMPGKRGLGNSKKRSRKTRNLVLKKWSKTDNNKGLGRQEKGAKSEGFRISFGKGSGQDCVRSMEKMRVKMRVLGLDFGKGIY